jgi:hypothetical protein
LVAVAVRVDSLRQTLAAVAVAVRFPLVVVQQEQPQEPLQTRGLTVGLALRVLRLVVETEYRVVVLAAAAVQTEQQETSVETQSQRRVVVLAVAYQQLPERLLVPMPVTRTLETLAKERVVRSERRALPQQRRTLICRVLVVVVAGLIRRALLELVVLELTAAVVVVVARTSTRLQQVLAVRAATGTFGSWSIFDGTLCSH